MCSSDLEPALKKLAQEQGVKGDHLEELVHDKKMNSAVLKQLQSAGQKGGLAGFEIIEGVVLADEEWTPQNVSLICRMLTLGYALIQELGSHHRCAEAEPQGYLAAVPEGSRPGVWPLMSVGSIYSQPKIEKVSSHEE